LAGDGSIMMNLQELQTIAGNNLPIKIFILNNKGYVSIFQTHRNFFGGVEVGGGPKSGVSFPDFSKLMPGFGLRYARCEKHENMQEAIQSTMEGNYPAVCEVFIDENVQFAPKLGSKQHADGTITSPALEDLSPFLDRQELLDNLLIKPFD
jgi:acetolactate synthase-1/2/3 large subunit